jgi:F-type H+-transporting ATPase subunit gamma
MANTKIIKQKIKGITSIKKITKTMEMVSFAKMKKTSEAFAKISSYISETKNLIDRISFDNEIISPLFVGGNKEGKEIVLIFASSKGLCGSFNSNVYKKTKSLIEENKDIKTAICFGKFADKIAKRLNLEIELSFPEVDKIASYTEMIFIEKYIRNLFLQKKYKTFFASYTQYIKNGLYANQTICLYPLSVVSESKKDDKQKLLSIHEPSPEIILESLLPKLVTLLLYSFVLESRVAEQSMRSFAMKRANESAGELLQTLKLKYNKVRQDSITQEIAEISAGANA